MNNHQHSPSVCDCKTDHRTLVLLAKNFAKDFPEFSAFGAGENWFYYPEYGIVQVEVGTGKRFSGAAEIFNFLRAAVGDQTRLENLRAAWLKGNQLPAQQLAEIKTDSEPISNLVGDGSSSELIGILQTGRIETWFQPIIEARTGNIWGYECLMRGRRADGSLVSAFQLLEWAKQENLESMLDRVCRETHLENAGFLNYGANCRFLINFLPGSVCQSECCLQTSLATMQTRRIYPRQIIFEVVESEKVVDSEHLLKVLDFYHQRGFGISLDDMVSGYKELGLIGDMQPDLIKIDREIVSKSVDSKTHYNLCAALVRIGRENGQLVLAEGVETEDELTLLESLGVDLFQGYYFGRPQPQPNFLPPVHIPYDLIGALRSVI